jgi:hypothetical protein
MNLLKKVSAVLVITLVFASINVYAQKQEISRPPDPLEKIHLLALTDWTPGSMQMCSWDWGNLKGNVKLTLWKGNQLVATLSPSCPVGLSGRGSANIQVPPNLTPGEYELRIVSLGNPKIADRRILKIIAPSTPTLTTPGVGEHKELKYEHKNELKGGQQGFPKTTP